MSRSRVPVEQKPPLNPKEGRHPVLLVRCVTLEDRDPTSQKDELSRGRTKKAQRNNRGQQLEKPTEGTGKGWWLLSPSPIPRPSAHLCWGRGRQGAPVNLWLCPSSTSRCVSERGLGSSETLVRTSFCFSSSLAMLDRQTPNHKPWLSGS